MTKLQRELKEMGINPSEWDLVLLDEDVLDELVIYDETDEDEEDY
jgi:hypothetical protein